MGREIGGNLGPWDVQYDGIVHLLSKESKAPTSPQTPLREGEVKPGEEVIDEGPQAISFQCYAAHFSMSPEAQAIVERLVREDIERNATRQREIEAKKVAYEL